MGGKGKCGAFAVVGDKSCGGGVGVEVAQVVFVELGQGVPSDHMSVLG